VFLKSLQVIWADSGIVLRVDLSMLVMHKTSLTTCIQFVTKPDRTHSRHPTTCNNCQK